MNPTFSAEESETYQFDNLSLTVKKPPRNLHIPYKLKLLLANPGLKKAISIYFGTENNRFKKYRILADLGVLSPPSSMRALANNFLSECHDPFKDPPPI